MRKSVFVFWNRADFGWIATVLLPLIGLAPTLKHGIINTADGLLHTHRIQAMTYLLSDGRLWPRWVPYFHLGFGYPIFNFYPPGTYLLGGLLGVISLNAETAFVVLSALAWIVGTMGVYALARRLLPPSGALLAAMLWAYAPSRLYEVYAHGRLPEMLAAAMIPWIFYGLVEVAQRPAWHGVLLTAFPLAGLVLFHLPMAYITGLFVAPAALILPLWAGRHDRDSLPRRLIATAGGLLLAVGLTAIFVLPMATELKYVDASREKADNVNYLISNFLPIDDVFMQPPPADLTDLHSDLPATLGLISGLFALVGLIGLARRRRFALAALLLAALVFTIFMLLEASLDVWLALPYFRQLRFSERFLRVGALLLALLGGSSLWLLPERWRTRALIITLPIVLLAALPMTYGNQRLIRLGDINALDEINFELSTYVWGTTSYDEFDPKWGESIPLPGEVPEPELYVTDPLRLVVYRLDVIRQFPDLQAFELDDETIRVIVADDRPVRFHQYYFPGWKATLDGQPVRIYPDDEMGLITLDVPAGEHLITLRYAGTSRQRAGALITLASLGVVIAGTALSLRRRWIVRRRADAAPPAEANPAADPTRRLGPRAALLVVAGLVAFTVINESYITPDTTWFRHQSAPDDPVYMEDTLNVPFGETFTLLGYTLEQDSVRPDRWLTVTLFWRPQAEIATHYRAEVQLVDLNVTESWGVSDPFFLGGVQVEQYTPDRFISDVHTFKVHDWAPPYVGRLSVQMFDIQTGEPLRLPDGSDRRLLEPLIRVDSKGPKILQTLDYRVGDVVELRCASLAPSPDGERLNIDLYWHTTGQPATDLTVMVHGLDQNGVMIEQHDALPLDGNYPASLWRSGQNLVDFHSLPNNPALSAVAVGLYNDAGRLPVTQDGLPVPENRIVLPIAEQPCTP